MSAEIQMALDALAVLSVMFFTWWAKGISDHLKELQKTDGELSARVQDVQILIAGQYVKRTEVADMLHGIDRKLDALFERLDDKVSKRECNGCGGGR